MSGGLCVSDEGAQAEVCDGVPFGVVVWVVFFFWGGGATGQYILAGWEGGREGRKHTRLPSGAIPQSRFVGSHEALRSRKYAADRHTDEGKADIVRPSVERRRGGGDGVELVVILEHALNLCRPCRHGLIEG